MANYTAADIKALREKTGAGMLDVKKALDEADGDSAKAEELLRIKGLKSVSKREGRSATDGLIAATVSDGVGTMVEVNCETDFVAKNERFVELGNQVLDAAVASGAQDVDALLAAPAGDKTVGDLITDAAARIGEKIEIRRVGRVEGAHLATYMHKTNPDLPPQIGVLVATGTDAPEVARDVAMHIAAMTPAYLNRDDVPAETVETERRIAEQKAVEEGKPEQAMAKIVEGRVNAFYKDNVLLDQAFAKEPKKSVGTVVADAGTTVESFLRFRVGS
ncbi:MAG: translation elongation factor Ts [Actinomycetales bacterium]